MFKQEMDCNKNDDRMEFLCELLNQLIGLPDDCYLSGIFSGLWGQFFEGEDNCYISIIDFEKYFRSLYQDLEKIVNEKASEKLISFCSNKFQAIHSIGNYYCDMLKIWEIRFGGGKENSRSILSNTSCKTVKYNSFSQLNDNDLKENIRKYHIKFKNEIEDCISFFSNKDNCKHSAKLLVVVMAIYSSLTLDYIHNYNTWDDANSKVYNNNIDKKYTPFVYELRDRIKEFQWSLGYSLTQFTKEGYSKLKDLNYTLKAAANINELDINQYEYPTKTVGANKINNENIVVADDDNYKYKIFKIQPNTLDMSIKGSYSSNHIDFVSGLYCFYSGDKYENEGQNINSNSSNSNNSYNNNTQTVNSDSRLNDKALLKGTFKLKDGKQFSACIVSVHFSNYYSSSLIKPNDNYEFTFYVGASSSKTNQTKSFVEKVDIKSCSNNEVPNETVIRIKSILEDNNNSKSINNKNNINGINNINCNYIWYGFKSIEVNPGFIMDKLLIKIEKFSTNIVIDNIQINFIDNNNNNQNYQIDNYNNLPSYPQS